ncbi:hypothetical protein [Lacibacter sp. H407]|uniref:hypothetical protein n=1 Tax=Lacibacter sp. H407 TaxID=3133423 RepID=UPI0030C4C260
MITITEDKQVVLFRWLWVLSAVAFLAVTLISLSPNLTIHHYRQSQTAITSLYLSLSEFKLSYLTPIMGSPWTVPMEFPLYQYLALVIHKFSGIDLIVAGKVINISAHIINNLLLLAIGKRLNISSAAVYIALIFYNLFPFYLVFDTVFLIDTFSLTLCLQAIYFLCEWFHYSKKYTSLFFFTIFGTLCGLSKSTTFIGILAPATALLFFYYANRQSVFAKPLRLSLTKLRFFLLATTGFVLAFFITFMWVKYADAVKQGNPLSAMWTSSATRTWNFGTLEQRLSINNWKQYFTYSMLSHLSSYMLVGILFVLFSVLSDKKQKLAALSLLLLYLAPLFFFFNLFFIHTYYSTANILFLYLFFGYMFWVVVSAKNRFARVSGWAVLLLFFVFGLYRSYAFRHQIIKNKPEPGVYSQLNRLPIQPKPNDVIVVVQNSRDPYIGFYFKCRSINLNEAEYVTNGKAEGIKKLAGGLPIVMLCIVSDDSLNVLPANYQGIFTERYKTISVSHYPETNKYYNFFW